MSISKIPTLVVLIFLCIAFNVLFNHTANEKSNKQLHNVFMIICLLFMSWLIGLILQIVFSSNPNINPIYFDYFIYISACFMPVLIFIMALIFAKTKVNFTKKYLLLFVIPIISLLLLWTNNYHHLFYKVYSVNVEETQFGVYFYVHSLYTYIMYIVALIYLLVYSIRNSGFFSKQAILIFIGTMIPLIVNILGALGVISMNIYLNFIS